MKPARLSFAALLVGTAALALGCGDRTPTGADSQAPGMQAFVHGNPWITGGGTGGRGGGGLLRCSPLSYDSVTQTIGVQGGTLHVGPHELQIWPGALQSAVSITAVMASDTVNRIRFRPAGLVFAKPAALTMSYKNCDTGSSAASKQIAYTDDSLNILEYEPSVDDVNGNKVIGAVSHFSEYAVSW